MRVYWRLRAFIWTDFRRRVALTPVVETIDVVVDRGYSKAEDRGL
jgi:hypothetical protein